MAPDGASSGAALLIVMQLASKAATFALNQALVRLVSPTSLGISSYLDFLLSTILFFSREAARLLVQRTPFNGTCPETTHQSIINFGYIPIFIGLPVSAAIFLLKGSVLRSLALSQIPLHRLIEVLTWLLICLELVVEPVYQLKQFQLAFKVRSRIEGMAVILKCLVTFVAILVTSKSELAGTTDSKAVLGFAMGQLAYSMTIFIGYALACRGEATKISLFLRKVPFPGRPGYFDTGVLNVWRNLFVQMIFKQILTQGDVLLINYLCTVEDQGVYSVISNYGSIVTRLVFQPIEESIRLSFTRILSSPEKEKQQQKDTGTIKSSITTTFETLKNLCLFYFNFSMLLVIAGYFNSPFLLKLLLGRTGQQKWIQTDIFALLPQYVLYLPTLAFNGVFEAVFSSFATTSDIQRFLVFMTALTAAVLMMLYLLIETLGWGLTGLVISNAFNMLLRISYCAVKINQFYAKNGEDISVRRAVRHIMPSVVCGLIFFMGQSRLVLLGPFTATVWELVYSALWTLVCALALIWLERKNLLESITWKKRKSD